MFHFIALNAITLPHITLPLHCTALKAITVVGHTFAHHSVVTVCTAADSAFHMYEHYFAGKYTYLYFAGKYAYLYFADKYRWVFPMIKNCYYFLPHIWNAFPRGEYEAMLIEMRGEVAQLQIWLWRDSISRPILSTPLNARISTICIQLCI